MAIELVKYMSAKTRSLSLDNKVLLTAFLRVLPNNKTKLSYNELLGSNISPAPYLNAHIFIELAFAKLIGKTGGVFSNQDDYITFNIVLNDEYSEKQLADLLLQISSTGGHSERDIRGVVTLMKNALVAECVQFFSDQLSLEVFEIELLKNPPKALLGILEHHTLAEIYTLIWEATSEFSLLEMKEQSVLEVLSEVCHSAQRIALWHATNKKPIKPYQKKEGSQCSLVTSILMENYFGLEPGKYFTSNVWPILCTNEDGF